jgi:hypothetical protein
VDVQTRVNRGMALLDAKCPGWDAKVDVARLQLSSCLHCVLGQLAGAGVFGAFSEYPSASRYVAGTVFLGLDDAHGQDAGDHGFSLSPRYDPHAGHMGVPDTWVELTKCWKAAILARRAAPVETAFIEQLKADLTTCT